jgi:peptide/nickel transport system permease protein
MTGYLVRRLIQAVPLLLGISIVLFGVIHLAPGGPVSVYASDPTLRPEDLERIKKALGLDQPVYVQYVKWLKGVAQGDWGRSFRERRPVLQMVMERLPNTLLLNGTALLIAIAVAIPIGVYTGSHPNSRMRYALNLFTLLGISVPTFWTGTIIILVFSARLGWLPTGGMWTIGQSHSLLDLLHHLIAPALVLAYLFMAQWARYVHSGFVEVLHQDYVRTARAKGLSGWTVLYRHGLRTMLIPLITLIGLQIPTLLSGSFVTEIVFAWPGLGRLIQDALLARDYSVAMGAFTMIAILVVISSILADVAYAIADPRIRF